MNSISTHVLDIATGRPAMGVAVSLEFLDPVTHSWTVLAAGKTDGNGHLSNLEKDRKLKQGLYRLIFDTDGLSQFFPAASVEFRIGDPAQHYHIPLIVSPYGYSTYRGS